MGLKETVNHLKKILMEVQYDLDKSEGGNKAAAQRVRTGTIKLAKISKVYRKESIAAEKKGGSGGKKAKKSAPAKKKGKKKR